MVSRIGERKTFEGVFIARGTLKVFDVRDRVSDEDGGPGIRCSDGRTTRGSTRTVDRGVKMRFSMCGYTFYSK